MIDNNHLLQMLKQPTTRHQAIQHLDNINTNSPIQLKSISKKLIPILIQIVSLNFDQQYSLNALKLLQNIFTTYNKQVQNISNLHSLLPGLSSLKVIKLQELNSQILPLLNSKSDKDQIIKAYCDVIRDSQNHKLTQKCLQSLEGLFISYDKTLAYLNDSGLLTILISVINEKIDKGHLYVQHCAQQTLTSILKNQYLDRHIQKLPWDVQKKLIIFCNKFNIKTVFSQTKVQVKEEQTLHVEKSCQQQYLDQQKIILNDLQPQKPWYLKCQTIQNLLKKLKIKNQSISQSLAKALCLLVADPNFKVSLVSLSIFQKYYPLNISNQVTELIANSVIQRMGDIKQTIRQSSINILSKHLQQQAWIKKLSQKIPKCNLLLKEQYITFCGQYLSVKYYKQMISTLCKLVQQKKTKLKIMTIDTLVKLSNRNSKLVPHISANLNSVYNDMFLQRLQTPNFSKSIPKMHVISSTPSSAISPDQNLLTINNSTNQAVESKNNYRTFNSLRTANSSNIPEHGYSNYSHFQRQPLFGTKYSKESQQVQSKTSDNIRRLGEREKSNGSREDISSFELQQKPVTRIKKMGKKINQDQQRQQDKQKYPLKPLLKKITKKQQNPLIIQSKQYAHKRPEDQRKYKQYKKQQHSFEQKQEKIQRLSLRKKNDKPLPDYKTTTYIVYSDLQPYQKPQNIFKKVLIDIRKDDDWQIQFQSINSIRRLGAHHGHILISNNTLFNQILVGVIKLIDSLRSSLAKNSMICIVQLVQPYRKYLQICLQPLLVKLFRKSQDSNSFISQQVKKCFIALSENITSTKIIPALQQYFQQKANSSRIYVGFCLQKIACKYGERLLSNKYIPRVLQMIGTLISDSSVQVRNSAKSAYLQLLKRINIRQQFFQQLRRSVQQSIYSKLKLIAEKQQPQDLFVHNGVCGL